MLSCANHVQRVTKLVKRPESKNDEEQLRELGLLSLEKKKRRTPDCSLQLPQKEIALKRASASFLR